MCLTRFRSPWGGVRNMIATCGCMVEKKRSHRVPTKGHNIVCRKQARLEKGVLLVSLCPPCEIYALVSVKKGTTWPKRDTRSLLKGETLAARRRDTEKRKTTTRALSCVYVILYQRRVAVLETV
ncbi:unnamed protein product [Ectocarpus sp. 6 AP-2014]